MREQFLRFVLFLRQNARWLLGGVLLTFFSSVGQTFFIALFAGDIRAEFNLSHGSFGSIYMLATLASAATLIFIGRVLDEVDVARVAAVLIFILAIACVLMASAKNVPVLLVSIYLLRLFGQGMMSHTALVAMGRWFVAERGRAVSVSVLGHHLGEGLLPLLIVVLLAAGHWQTIWLVAACVLVVIALPLSQVFLSVPRSPNAPGQPSLAESGRQWTRAEVLRDAPFWAVCTGVLAPAFIGTSVFFHQVHLGEIKQWPAALIASSFAVMSMTSVCVGLATGLVIDRFSARQVLPFFLFPLALGCTVLALGSHPATMWVFMCLLGSSYGISGAVFGSIWPEVYGVRHLGAVRAMVSSAMVFASALGPGLTGWLIDRGTGLETQLLCMSAYCLATLLVLFSVSRTLQARLAPAHG